jgi:hypothetical protein
MSEVHSSSLLKSNAQRTTCHSGLAKAQPNSKWFKIFLQTIQVTPVIPKPTYFD